MSDLRRAVVVLGIAVMAGCTPGSMASRGAASGAQSGALGGAVAGAVGSIFWGGNVVENMVTSAAVGAASGAAIGAASGAGADKRIEERREIDEKYAAIAQKMGYDNFEAAEALAKCKHARAIGLARTAYGTSHDPEHRRYALMIEAIAAEESGDAAAAEKIYPLMVQVDPAYDNVDSARAAALAGILKIQKIRQEHGAPPTCS